MSSLYHDFALIATLFPQKREKVSFRERPRRPKKRARRVRERRVGVANERRPRRRFPSVFYLRVRERGGVRRKKSGRPDGGKPRRGRGVRFRRRAGQDLQRSVDGKTTGRFGGNGESGGKRYAKRKGRAGDKEENEANRPKAFSPGRGAIFEKRRNGEPSVPSRVFCFFLLTNAQTSAIIRSVNAASPSGKATDSDSVIT